MAASASELTTSYRNLLGWYNCLHSRTVDLVGDYAGDDLFIIEGDSLLLHAFCDEQLDFSPGLQILHATYIVEAFLNRLRQRRCVFQIIFFTDHAHLCIPNGVAEELRPRYLFAREAIIQHLCQNAAPSIEIKIFKNYRLEDFRVHLPSSGAYFFMCHDGALSESIESRGIDSDIEESDESESEDDYSEDDISGETPLGSQSSRSKFDLRLMINWLMSHGYNIALINSVEFKDSKIMTMIVEGSAPKAKKLLCSLMPIDTNGVQDLSDSEEHPTQFGSTGMFLPVSYTAGDAPLEFPQAEELLKRLVMHNPDLTQRQCLAIASLSIMLNSDTIGCTTDEAKAMILHTVLLQNIQMLDRLVESCYTDTADEFFNKFAKTALSLLSSRFWRETMSNAGSVCDLSDAVDARLFLKVHRFLMRNDETIPLMCLTPFTDLVSLLNLLSGANIPLPQAEQKQKIPTNPADSSSKYQNKCVNISTRVLPFKNPVFEAHLQPIRLSIDNSANSVTETETSKLFQELTHWHNHRRPLDQKAKVPLTPLQILRSQRRNQFFMAEMRDYALTMSSSGGAFEPETVFATSAKAKQQKITSSATTEVRNSGSTKTLPKSGKKVQSKGSKPSVKDMAAFNAQQKELEAIQKQIQKWVYKRATLDKESGVMSRFIKARTYFSGLAKDSRLVLEAEVLIYMLDTLLQILIDTEEKQRQMNTVALIWNTINCAGKVKSGIPADGVSFITAVTKLLGLPSIDVRTREEDKLSFKCASPLRFNKVDINTKMSPMEFQLMHAGPFMDRNMDSAPDPRTPDFEPDRWQRDVLDQIDEKKSVFVVAPTSAGKTFISFYAMKQILKEDDDGVLVYVAPTKALVNQIAAEIQARFSKNYNAKHGGKSVWAIHTRDYRINNPNGCQILVTVPHILQIMLLSPSNAKSWSPRVKRIIFDEIHCIGQAEDGVIWEQLLLLSPCPIIALSATVGNPREFCDWLSLTQKANNIDLTMIEHRHRYSELRKYTYNVPHIFSFKRLPDPVPLAPLDLDDIPEMSFVHPVASLVDRSRGMPDDLSLEPRDCFTLWKAMMKHQTKNFPVDPSLDPSVTLPAVIRKLDIVHWQQGLKAQLTCWMKDGKSPFAKVINELEPVSKGESQLLLTHSPITAESESGRSVQTDDPIETTLPLVCSLYAQNALPALFFNYDRAKCEEICRTLLTRFQDAEKEWKEVNPAWKAKVAQWEEWKKYQEKASKKAQKIAKKDTNDGEMSKADRARDTASAETSWLETFDPDRPVEGFHVADIKKLTPSQFQEYANKLRHFSIADWLIDALERGIGVHHAGMNRKYRQVCEMLFRRGFLRVVIATGTLALGINMPCKTVVFSGDSVFLTALNFRQAAGRAGRRGFDMLGNVVFQGISYAKICRLISSRLPDLNGHFPITTSLVLRLFILLNESKQSVFAIKAINSLLSCPRIYLGGPAMRDTVLHHLRFSIEYLRRNRLLSSTGAPLNFAGCVSHLYYTENSSFAFHALLEGGYFHKLCQGINSKPKSTLLTLMLTMAHIFGRINLRSSIIETFQRGDSRTSSLVLLPPMPRQAAQILHLQNKKTLGVYAAYVTTFIEQHIQEPDCTLPLSNMKCGGDHSAAELGVGWYPEKPTRVTSPFFALSGHRDEWDSVYHLCRTVRSGIWLEESVIPYVSVEEDERKMPLNAYLYDFFKHGNVHELESANRVRRGDVWFVLNDFSLILATIVTSFENFLQLSSNVDVDMIDVMGGGDAHENELDDHVIENGAPVTTHGAASAGVLPIRQQQVPTAAPLQSNPPTQKTKKKVTESWDDDLSDDSEDNGEFSDGYSDVKKSNNQGDTPSIETSNVSSVNDLLLVLKAFRMLQSEFNQKFRAMWA
ncbi:hypothetical protein LOZ51_005071 [Ophidiomyces ophidiicola]|nr:hypothetical protein LOZ55_005479 [Ophidiomyces ophidiicola]KAI1989147.1 hypothetical protein LOZ54_002968 [Ophidiomyces ophidiicola]KAI1989826.1 hypothetical protein LOZ51_005071 [Ophidiomyces ophidiicola]